jgi:RNA polymerase sigma-70 factor (ECF subfamily)
VAVAAQISGVWGAFIEDPAPAKAAIDLTAAFRAHGAFVFRILRRMGVADASLDDAVQEVFLVAHRRHASYDPDAAMRSWLYGIARRVASHHHRHRRRHPEDLSDAIEGQSTDSLERNAEQREAMTFVRSFLDQLDEAKRMVFVLSDIEGMTAPEVAETLGVKLNTVYSRQRAARQAFDKAVARRRAAEQRRSS